MNYSMQPICGRVHLQFMLVLILVAVWNLQQHTGKSLYLQERRHEIEAIADENAKFQLNFLSVASKTRYQNWLLPYSMFALRNNKESCAEIAILNSTSFKERYAKLIDVAMASFPGRIFIRNINTTLMDVSHRLVSNADNAVRFLEKPHIRSTYTYIGDVDILTLDADMVQTHVEHIKQLGLPYSNIIRNYKVPASEMRLTGLHFVENHKYYGPEFDKALALLQKMEERSLRLDEVLLRALCELAFGLPPPDRPNLVYRPVHGIHLSNNRGFGKMALAVTCDQCEAYYEHTREAWFRAAFNVSVSFQSIHDRTATLCHCCFNRSSNTGRCQFNDREYTLSWLAAFDSIADDLAIRND